VSSPNGLSPCSVARTTNLCHRVPKTYTSSYVLRIPQCSNVGPRSIQQPLQARKRQKKGRRNLLNGWPNLPKCNHVSKNATQATNSSRTLLGWHVKNLMFGARAVKCRHCGIEKADVERLSEIQQLLRHCWLSHNTSFSAFFAPATKISQKTEPNKKKKKGCLIRIWTQASPPPSTLNFATTQSNDYSSPPLPPLLFFFSYKLLLFLAMLELPNLQEWFLLLVELNTSGTQNSCLLANDDEKQSSTEAVLRKSFFYHGCCFAWPALEREREREREESDEGGGKTTCADQQTICTRTGRFPILNCM